MKAIYTRTIGVYDDKLGEAMEISKGLAEIRKKHYPDHEVYFSFQIGGNPRTVRETLVGEQFTDKAFENDQNMSADPKFIELQKKMKGVFKEGMEKFRQMSGPTIGEHGGKVLVREPSPDVREGGNLGTVVLIEFESIDAARKFYESEKYQAAKAVRELAAKAHLVLVEGN